MHLSLPPRDMGLIAFVVLAWGSNFTAMKIGLGELPPLLFVGLRFLILVPLILVIPKPDVPWWKIIGVGVFINTGQFAFLFSAMEVDITAGLGALFLQAQAPFTILLSVLLFSERVSWPQIIGILVAAAGMAVIGTSGGGNVTVLGLVLVLAGALSWAIGNLILKTLRHVPMLPLFIWSSLVPPIPMFAASWAFETATPWAEITGLTATGWGSVIYVAVISTVLGYTAWGSLLARHPAASVTPYALLIPVVGIVVAAAVLGERLSLWDAIGAVIVLAGLAIVALATHRRREPA